MIGLVRVVLGRPELMGFSSRASCAGSVWFSKHWYRILLSKEYLGSELCRILAFDCRTEKLVQDKRFERTIELGG